MAQKQSVCDPVPCPSVWIWDTLVSLCQQASWYVNRDGTEPVVQLELLPSKIEAF